MFYYEKKFNLLKEVLLREHKKQLERKFKYMFIN